VGRVFEAGEDGDGGYFIYICINTIIYMYMCVCCVLCTCVLCVCVVCILLCVVWMFVGWDV